MNEASDGLMKLEAEGDEMRSEVEKLKQEKDSMKEMVKDIGNVILAKDAEFQQLEEKIRVATSW